MTTTTHDLLDATLSPSPSPSIHVIYVPCRGDRRAVMTDVVQALDTAGVPREYVTCGDTTFSLSYRPGSTITLSGEAGLTWKAGQTRTDVALPGPDAWACWVTATAADNAQKTPKITVTIKKEVVKPGEQRQARLGD